LKIAVQTHEMTSVSDAMVKLDATARRNVERRRDHPNSDVVNGAGLPWPGEGASMAS
jgi:hypothetical protein